ncbi:MAG TPA: replication-associated recombination protein A [Terriglobia bacterium]|nr:replication-associated recombination protein A [Terriglobia bacterium]
MSGSLFEEEQPNSPPPDAPLADRLRPQTLDEVLGQGHLLDPGKPLRTAIERDQVPSMILWGPPGVGKTTLARIIAKMTKSTFVPFSAVLSGIKEIKEIMAAAERARRTGRRTIVFVDEIHRFNKAQQDAFLPHVERGNIVLIGATTENPSFEVISALLSRTRVFVLKALSDEDVATVVRRAVARENFNVDQDSIRLIAMLANGDARTALNILDLAVQGTPPGQQITKSTIEQASQKTLLYDKTGEEHYNIISALHKSLRNSDVDASLYWLARMLEAGEDPLYIARRLVRFASEDIGLADPRALRIALDAKDAFNFIGLPEGKLALAQCVIYLAAAPKSNSVYTAYDAVVSDVENTRNDPVPLHIRNAPTGLMKQLGYGKGYQYAHDLEGKVADMDCLPESLKGRKYYHAQETGEEAEIQRRLDEVARKKRSKKIPSQSD